MADINISELPSISSATNDDVFIINDANATTSRINWSQLKTSIDSLNAAQVKFLSGTESNPSITFVGDLNTGIYNPGLDQLGIVTNGASRFHIDAAGKIGIGNKTPSSYSTSLNNLVVGDLEGDNGIIISSSPTEAGAYIFSDSFSEFPGRIVYDHDDDHMHFEVDSLEKVRITQVGSVGIGTSSPQETLHVRSSVSGVTGTQSNLSGVIIEGGDTTDTGVQFFTPNDKSAGLFFSDPENFGIGHLKYDNVNNRFAFQTNNVESVYIDSTGSVGIGSVPSDRALSITKDATGSSSYSGIHISSAIQSDVNLDFRYFRSSAVTQGTSFNLIDLYHFSATQDTLGAGSTVTNQYGFAVDSGMTGAVNNYGFFSNLPQGANTYNFYSNGDADNYFNGNKFIIASNGVDGFVVVDGIGTFSKALVLTPGPSVDRPNPASAGTLRYNSDFNNVEAYNGDAWGSIGGSIDTSPTPPTNAVNGDMWFDTEAGRTFVYYDDGDSVQWVEMNPSLNGGIANNSVTTSSLVDNAVTTPKIADGSVTDAKLALNYVQEAPENGISFVRRNASWIAALGSTSVSSTYPTPTGVGQQFYNLDDGRLYIVIEDSSTNLVWVDASPDAGLAGGSELNVPLVSTSSATFAGNVTAAGINIPNESAPNLQLKNNGTIELGTYVSRGRLNTYGPSSGAASNTAFAVDIADDANGLNQQQTVNIRQSGAAKFANGNILLNADGSATFVGSVTAGGSSTDGAGLFAVSYSASTSSPAVLTRSYEALGSLFTGFSSTGSQTVNIRGDGSATFSVVTAAGQELSADGVMGYRSEASGTATTWRGFGGSSLTSQIFADGSATFAGKLTSDTTISSDSGSTLATKSYVDSGVASAWGNFSGSDGSLRDGNNASVSKDSSGVYTVTFSSALANANYSIVVSTTNDPAVGALIGANYTDQTSSGFKIKCYVSGSVTLANPTSISFTVFGG